VKGYTHLPLLINALKAKISNVTEAAA
jgi:hypothetical protein